MDWDKLTFTLTPTDNMFYTESASGVWAEGEIKPYGNISISPAAAVLNYGQGLFEGMKAQRSENGDIMIFRPDRNAARMAQGAARLGMLEVPEELFIRGVKACVKANARWVPPPHKGALYIRPVLWGSGAILGVASAPSYTFMIYCSPVGPYFKGGMSPISLLCSDEFHRAAPGGQGGIKAVGNYSAGIVPSLQAKAAGHAEVIYLDAVEKKYIEEVGSANFFCCKGNTVYTPSLLVGTILPGVTRMSIIQIAKDYGFEVEECRLSVEQAMDCDEAWCTGTAAVISPIGKITRGDKSKEFCNGEVGPLTRKLYDHLTKMQVGEIPDPHGWVVKVEM